MAPNRFWTSLRQHLVHPVSGTCASSVETSPKTRGENFPIIAYSFLIVKVKASQPVSLRLDILYEYEFQIRTEASYTVGALGSSGKSSALDETLDHLLWNSAVVSRWSL